jgi:hypothetical protein
MILIAERAHTICKHHLDAVLSIETKEPRVAA